MFMLLVDYMRALYKLARVTNDLIFPASRLDERYEWTSFPFHSLRNFVEQKQYKEKGTEG